MATGKGDEADVIDEIDVPRISGRGASLRSALEFPASGMRSSVLALLDDVDGVGDVETRASLVPRFHAKASRIPVLAPGGGAGRFNIVAAKFLC